MMKLYPIEHLESGKLEWFTCYCGNGKFSVFKEYLEGGEPQLGVVEKHFKCNCGESYIWEYGKIRREE